MPPLKIRESHTLCCRVDVIYFNFREKETGGIRGVQIWAKGDRYIKYQIFHWNRSAYDVEFKCLTSNINDTLLCVFQKLFRAECLRDFANATKTVHGQFGFDHPPGSVVRHNCPGNRTGYSMYCPMKHISSCPIL